MADLNLKVGQSSTASVVPLEADGVTVTPGASLSSIVWTLTDPGLTTVVNPDNTLTITAVAGTTADVTGTVTATVTDADGVTAPLSKTFTVSVATPTGRTTQLGVRFTTPA